jgi:hypothetical protein
VQRFGVMFFGSCSPRRTQIVIQLAKQFDQCGGNASASSASSAPPSPDLGVDLPPLAPLLPTQPYVCQPHKYQLLCGNWESGVFDATRYNDVMASRVILNIHHDEESVLEVHRINYLLSLGKCVVSERSDDLELDAAYEAGGGVLFLDADIASDTDTESMSMSGMSGMSGMYAYLVRLLGDPQAIEECEGRARAMYSALSADTSQLDRALVHAIKAARLG